MSVETDLRDIRKRAAEWSGDPNPLHHAGDHHHRTAQGCLAYAVEDRAALLLLLDDAREANVILRAGNAKQRDRIKALIDVFMAGYPSEHARLVAVGQAIKNAQG